MTSAHTLDGSGLIETTAFTSLDLGSARSMFDRDGRVFTRTRFST
jgi:hypothetical protein